MRSGLWRELVLPTVIWSATSAVLSFVVCNLAYLVLGITYPPGLLQTIAVWAPLVAPLLLAPVTTFPRVLLQMRLRETNARLAEEIERRQALQAELEHQSRHDPLTAVLNRRGFFERVAAAPDGGVLVVLDLDRFKAVNDVYGHQAGDAVLVAIADALRDVLRERAARDADERSAIARLGGDEFVVLLPPDGLPTAQAIRSRLGRLEVRLPDDTELVVSASVGISVVDASASIEDALAQGDEGMYRSKRKGADGASMQALS